MTQWLVDTTLYTGLLIGAVLLLRRPVARSFGPQIAYALWALPLLRLFLPPLVLPASLAPQPESITAAPLMLAAVETSPFDEAAMPVAEATFALAWSDLLVPLWLGGAMAFLVWRTITYRRMRHEVLAEARPVGEVGRIRLVETPAVGAPVAFGVLDKVVALPPLFMAQRDRTARDLAITHELAHHRGHDLAANFAAQVLLALHWFNPLAWLGWRAMRRDQEAACDARVMAGQGREERARYAALIAGIAAGPRLALTAPMACPVLGEASIVHRLRSLSRADLSPRRRWMGRALLATSALALPLTASISYAAEAQEEGTLTLPPAPVAPPAPPAPPLPPEAIEAPEPPEAPEAPEPPERPGAPGAQRQYHVHRIIRGEPEAADAEAFAREMERFAQRMERFADLDEERIEREAERIERQAERAEREAERAANRQIRVQTTIRPRIADAEARADSFLMSCTGSEPRNAEEREQLAMRCETRIAARTRDGLQEARRAIASNRDMPEDIRGEILRELDREIARLGDRS